MKHLLESSIFVSMLTILLSSLAACGGGTSINNPREVDWQTAVEILNNGQVTEITQLQNFSR